MADIEISLPNSRELERLGELGPTSHAEKETDDSAFSARVGDQPIGSRLRTISEGAGIAVKSEIFARFEVWLIPHRVSVIRRRGLAEPVAVGIEVEYDPENATCCIASLIPAFDFIVRGEIGAKVRCRGGFSASGEALPMGVGTLDHPAAQIGSMSLGVAADGVLGFEWHASIATARIQAVGIGSTRCEWRFDRDVEPLYGRDIETWSVLILPKRKRTLNYRMRFYFVTRTLFLPTRRQSDWYPLTCQLQD